ncbi:MAG: Flp pilus assembly protein CpaB [Hyphomonadaceae bacterium]|nr:MAG: pilus assembly protein CpaB [Caulobacteraceae bacterium]MBT9447008.1 Flp pilus assembly protein CpaB [Hyphomonadaceae bacterium]TPW08817.1 MAG: pilus assembly protein CpaB [Alphaproteobacteria bacterium]
MSVRQIIVLAVALLAAIGALVMVRGLGNRTQKAEPTVAVTGPRVLVASKDVAPGVALQPSDLEWRMWTPTALSPSFIEESEDAKALETYTGAVARQALVAGEPIIEGRVVKPGDQGFMAAIVAPGFRAVSVPISEETAASGFILPNDRVDVILTRKVNVLDISGGSTEEVRSGIVLTNVRVLAIDKTYKTETSATAPEPIEGSVALLELSPRDSELLAMADEMGDLSLALRPVMPVSGKDRAGSSQRNSTMALEQNARAARDQIRVHSFGSAKDQTVVSQGAN